MTYPRSTRVQNLQYAQPFQFAAETNVSKPFNHACVQSTAMATATITVTTLSSRDHSLTRTA